MINDTENLFAILEEDPILDTASAEGEEDTLKELERSYRTIAHLEKRSAELEEEMDRLVDELTDLREENERIRSRCRSGIRWLMICALASLVLAFLNEICWTGWGLFRAVTGVLGISQTDTIGAATAAAAAFLLWKLGKWIIRCMKDDFDETEKEMDV